jgi:hypothetical protein
MKMQRAYGALAHGSAISGLERALVGMGLVLLNGGTYAEARLAGKHAASCWGRKPALILASGGSSLPRHAGTKQSLCLLRKTLSHQPMAWQVSACRGLIAAR